ncbi:MAG: Rrf2 family transcriptional regulator [Acidobacteria bacterium]|nr:Rrf2 family transcriptional regulator [Acidobacteriota bacterium]
MQLRNHVEWALHCAAVLAALPEGHYLAARHLAELHGVPREYLAKALQALSQAGLVETTLGPTGGYRLARAPHAITFLDIVEAVEGKASSFECTEIRKNNPCRAKNTRPIKPCSIAAVMWKADKAWRDSLRETRLSDLIGMVQNEVDPETLKKTIIWISERI